MILAPKNELVFTGFSYQCAPGTIRDPSGVEQKTQVLMVIDPTSGLKLDFIFSEPEFEKFISNLDSTRNRIVIATEMPG